MPSMHGGRATGFCRGCGEGVARYLRDGEGVMLASGVGGGRRRVSPDEGYVTVVGGANLDISGAPFKELIQRDSNPGLVTSSPGGVGRNISPESIESIMETNCEIIRES